MRHPGVALAIAGVISPGDKSIIAAVLLFILVNALVTIPYGVWCKRRHIPAITPQPFGRRSVLENDNAITKKLPHGAVLAARGRKYFVEKNLREEAYGPSS